MPGKRKQTNILGLALALGLTQTAGAVTVKSDLTIASQEINITGKPVPAMTLNGSIPGPVLRFREGDTARITVHNAMTEDTSIHWHGLLVPPDMDGVPNISFPPIAPGDAFIYEFPIRQAGTYWYHSHTDVQEQRGVYGAIVIEPRQPSMPASREHVVLLSDWTDENPHAVLRTLKRGSEWYALEKGAAQSIAGAARAGALGAYFQRELLRMPPMDIADVAYDRFLANGAPEIHLDANPGETVRLRLIDGSATTYFHLEFAGGPLTVVAADGQDVEPVELERLLIGVAETYDVRVTVPGNGAYELRATAHDGSAYASVWLGTGDRQAAPATPRPDLYRGHAMELSWGSLLALTPGGSMGMPDTAVEAGRFDQPGMTSMGGMHGAGHGGMGEEAMPSMSHPMNTAMSHGGGHPTQEPRSGAGAPPSGRRFATAFHPLAADVSSTANLAMDGMDSRRPWAPYDKLRATRSTALPAGQPVRELRFTLDGDMERYVWLLNDKTLSESDVVRIREGEVVRFILINRTRMHHPMHLHGHFFRVVNGQGDRSPLKHTVDVAPMSTTVIEFDANEVGDWFFHCHLLYHMKSGMARVVHYDGFDAGPEVAAGRPALYRDPWYAWGQVNAMTHMTEGTLQASNTRNVLAAGWEVGWQRVDNTEWEGIATWERVLNRFTSLFAGGDFFGANGEIEDGRGVAGLRYLLPLSIESRLWLDSDLGARISLDRRLDLTPRLGLSGEVEYDTHSLWEGQVAADYTLTRAVSILGNWHSEFGWGAGVRVRF